MTRVCMYIQYSLSVALMMMKNMKRKATNSRDFSLLQIDFFFSSLFSGFSFFVIFYLFMTHKIYIKVASSRNDYAE